MTCVSCGRSSVVKGASGLIRSTLNIGIAADEVVAERRRSCESCDRWDHGRCGECGCYTHAKTRLRSESCPLGRWSRVDA